MITEPFQINHLILCPYSTNNLAQAKQSFQTQIPWLPPSTLDSLDFSILSKSEYGRLIPLIQDTYASIVHPGIKQEFFVFLIDDILVFIISTWIYPKSCSAFKKYVYNIAGKVGEAFLVIHEEPADIETLASTVYLLAGRPAELVEKYRLLNSTICEFKSRETVFYTWNITEQHKENIESTGNLYQDYIIDSICLRLKTEYAFKCSLELKVLALQKHELIRADIETILKQFGVEPLSEKKTGRS